MTPKTGHAPKGSGFSVWCHGCGTYGYAFDKACVTSFERRHGKCPEAVRQPARGLS